jgi:hypothetical protein
MASQAAQVGDTQHEWCKAEPDEITAPEGVDEWPEHPQGSSLHRLVIS